MKADASNLVVSNASSNATRTAPPASRARNGRGPSRVPPEGHPLRYIHTRRPRCPNCNAPDPLAYGTLASDPDDALVRYVECKECGHCCIHVQDDGEEIFPCIPESGKRPGGQC